MEGIRSPKKMRFLSKRSLSRWIQASLSSEPLLKDAVWTPSGSAVGAQDISEMYQEGLPSDAHIVVVLHRLPQTPSADTKKIYFAFGSVSGSVTIRKNSSIPDAQFNGGDTPVRRSQT